MRINELRNSGSPVVRVSLYVIFIIVAVLVCGIIINGMMIGTTKGSIKGVISGKYDHLTKGEIEKLADLDADCIMVLGASVYSGGKPSPMLRDRLDTAIELYQEGVAPKLLLTGDSGQIEYNEVGPMRKYCVDRGVDPEDIFCDYAGFSTYESIYRSSYIFRVEKMVVVTQKYHLYRALYGCKKMGIEAVGAAADQERYVGQAARDAREVLARIKDAGKWILKPEPTYLGEQIPITGRGNGADVSQ